MTFRKVRITAEDLRKFRSYTLASIFGIKLIETIETPDLIAALDIQSASNVAIANRIGPQTNPSWVMARAAEELCFTRNAITIEQFDFLTQ